MIFLFLALLLDASYGVCLCIYLMWLFELCVLDFVCNWADIKFVLLDCGQLDNDVKAFENGFDLE